MGLPLDAAWEKSSEVFLKIAPKTEKDISVLHNGVSPRCSSMARNRKGRLEEKIIFFYLIWDNSDSFEGLAGINTFISY